MDFANKRIAESRTRKTFLAKELSRSEGQAGAEHARKASKAVAQERRLKLAYCVAKQLVCYVSLWMQPGFIQGITRKGSTELKMLKAVLGNLGALERATADRGGQEQKAISRAKNAKDAKGKVIAVLRDLRDLERA